MSIPFHIAMIGAGSRANAVIYPAFASLDDVEIVGICDINPERLNSTANKYNIPKRYGVDVNDYQNMLLELKPDAVVAVGQPHIMYDIWYWVIEHGFNLMIEKPFALTAHQARSLTWLAQKHHVTTQVSFQRRNTPMIVKMRELCLERGPINFAMCKFYKSEIKPFLGARDHMMDDCVHAIDTLRWMVGGEVIKVESVTRRIMTPDINFISATLFFDNGSIGYLINNWASGKRIFSVEMHAPGIFVEAEHEGKAFVYADGNLTPRVFDTNEVSGSSDNFIFTGVQNKARNFVDACKNGAQAESCFDDALKTMLVAEQILAQNLFEL